MLLFVTYHLMQILFVQAFVVRSDAMAPALTAGDRVLAAPMSYGPRLPAFGYRLPGLSQPRRGDIVLVEPPYYERPGVLRSLLDPLLRFFSAQRLSLTRDPEDVWRSPLVVKRVLGLPGDRIRFELDRAYLLPRGKQPVFGFRSEHAIAEREYELRFEQRNELLEPDSPFAGSIDEIELGEDEFFVVGDNRPRSLDSRHWGAVPFAALRGRLVLRYFPPGDRGRL